MRRFALAALAMFSIGAFGALTANTVDAKGGQVTGTLAAPDLKMMLEGLGHELKVLNAEVGKEKYEFTINTDAFKVPIGAEISPSKNYVWLTVSLGDAPKADTAPASKFEAMLKSNAATQPCFFYITSKGFLMMAVALENRALTPAILKRNIDKLSKDVADSSSVWQK